MEAKGPRKLMVGGGYKIEVGGWGWKVDGWKSRAGGLRLDSED